MVVILPSGFFIKEAIMRPKRARRKGKRRAREIKVKRRKL